MSLFLIILGVVLYFVMPAAFAGTLGVKEIEAAVGSVKGRIGGDFAANLGVFCIILGVVLWIALFYHQLKNVEKVTSQRVRSLGGGLPQAKDAFWDEVKQSIRSTVRKRSTAAAFGLAGGFMVASILGGPTVVYLTCWVSILLVLALNVVFPAK